MAGGRCDVADVRRRACASGCGRRTQERLSLTRRERGVPQEGVASAARPGTERRRGESRSRPEAVAAGALEVRAPKSLRADAFGRRVWGSPGVNPAKTQGLLRGVDSASFASGCRARATRGRDVRIVAGPIVGLGRDQELALEVLRVPAFAYPAHGGANCAAGSIRSVECRGPARPASCHDPIYVRCRARICVGVPPSLPRHQRVNADCSENPTRPATSTIA